eukprot:ANDGO_07958.mRNA.1 hypothetical protein
MEVPKIEWDLQELRANFEDGQVCEILEDTLHGQRLSFWHSCDAFEGLFYFVLPDWEFRVMLSAMVDACLEEAGYDYRAIEHELRMAFPIGNFWFDAVDSVLVCKPKTGVRSQYLRLAEALSLFENVCAKLQEMATATRVVRRRMLPTWDSVPEQRPMKN